MLVAMHNRNGVHVSGLLLAMKTNEDGGPPSAQAKQHSKARALMAPGISQWLALLRDTSSIVPGLHPPSGRLPLDSEQPMRRNNPAFVEAFRRCGEGLLANAGGGEQQLLITTSCTES